MKTKATVVGPDRPLHNGEDAITWAVETGRIPAARAAFHRGQNLDRAVVAALAPGIPIGTPLQAAPSSRSPLAAVFSGPSQVETRPSVWNQNVRVKVDAYAANPLIDDAKQASPDAYAQALNEGRPMSTLFATGDLPVFIACGADPSILMRFPWQARHAAAVADATSFAAMLERYSGDGWPEAEFEHGRDDGNDEYYRRALDWLSGRGVATSYQLADMEAQRQRTGGAHPAKDEAIYGSLFGADDAGRAAVKAASDAAAAERLRAEQERRDRPAKLAAERAAARAAYERKHGLR